MSELKQCENCRYCYEQSDWDLGRMARCEVHDSDVKDTQEACLEWSSSIFCPNFKCRCVTGKEPCIKEDNPKDCEKCERNGQCPNCCHAGNCKFQYYLNIRIDQESKELRHRCFSAMKSFLDERAISKVQREKIAELEADRDRLREALKEVLNCEVVTDTGDYSKGGTGFDCNEVKEIIRGALEGVRK